MLSRHKISSDATMPMHCGEYLLAGLWGTKPCGHVYDTCSPHIKELKIIDILCKEYYGCLMFQGHERASWWCFFAGCGGNVLLDIPTDILDLILDSLDWRDKASVGGTCRGLLACYIRLLKRQEESVGRGPKTATVCCRLLPFQLHLSLLQTDASLPCTFMD